MAEWDLCIYFIGTKPLSKRMLRRASPSDDATERASDSGHYSLYFYGLIMHQESMV